MHIVFFLRYLLSGYFLLGTTFTDHWILGADLIMCLKEVAILLLTNKLAEKRG